MQNNVSNIKYNQLLYNSRPVRFDEYITNKYDKIHHQLFEDALKKFILSLNDPECKTITDFKSMYNFIEFKDDEYWKPSKIVYITKKYPFKKKTVDLKEYWNTYQEDKNELISNIKFNNEKMHIDMFELIDIDYIKGKVKLRNKMKNTEFWTRFDRINDSIEVSDDYSLANLFSSKINF